MPDLFWKLGLGVDQASLSSHSSCLLSAGTIDLCWLEVSVQIPEDLAPSVL